MRAQGRCRTGGGFTRNEAEVLNGVLADDGEVPEDAERLHIPSYRCAACIARGVRCFHDPISYETQQEG